MGIDTIQPSTVDSLSTGLQVAGLLASTFGAYKKSSGEQSAYTFQSAIARRNAALGEQRASDAITRGQTTENAVRQKTAQLKSTQIASLAARGIDLGSGSALDILTSTDVMGERDALIARDNANKEAWGYQVQAADDTNNAGLLAWRAGQQNPGMDAATTLLGGAGRVAASWFAMRDARTGTPPAT